MPVQPTGAILHSSAVAYAVYLVSGGGVSQSSIPLRVLARYPELELGVAEDIAAEAIGQVTAGVALGVLPPDRALAPGDVPIDRDLTSGYRYQMRASIIGADGVEHTRSVIWDDAESRSRAELEDWARGAIEDQAGASPGARVRDRVAMPIQGITVTITAVGRAAGG